MRDGSITPDDYEAQSLEVVRQVGTGLFMIRIDHLMYNDYVRNPLLDDLVVDFDDEPGIDRTARDSDQTNSFDCVTHATANVRVCEMPRTVLHPDTIVVSCGLCELRAVFLVDTSSPRILGNARRTSYKGGLRQVRSQLEGQSPGICKAIDCRKFDDPDNDRSMRKDIGRNPKIMMSILESGNYLSRST